VAILKSEKPAAEGTANRLQKSAHTAKRRDFFATISAIAIQASRPDPAIVALALFAFVGARG